MELLAERYELGRVLGTGGMAEVYEAHDRLLGRRVALKRMRADLAADPSVRERFLREARSAARLSHPHAVAVYDTGVDGRHPWIVMELVQGESLAERLAAGPLDPEEAVAIATAVLDALEAAHRAGLVHRDVKPANILLPAAGGVKLTDFGIAKGVQEATAGLTATGQVIGTAKYLSPEQVDGRPATPSSDVYAMGVVLYEMLAGDPPFTADSAIALALAHLNDEPPPLRQRRPDLDRTLLEVVARALAKDPAHRYADAGQMRDALAGRAVTPTAPAPTAVLPAAAAGGASVAAAAETRVLEDAPRPRSRAPWVLAGAAVLLVLAALALAALDGGTATGTRPDAAAPERAQEPRDAEPPADPGRGAGRGAGRRDDNTAPPTERAQEPEPTAAPPEDLPGLLGFLADNPGAYGEKQPDLVDKLGKVLSEDDPAKQGEEARKLQEEVGKWVGKGQLDPEVGQRTVELLAPLAAQEAPDDEAEDDEEDD